MAIAPACRAQAWTFTHVDRRARVAIAYAAGKNGSWFSFIPAHWTAHVPAWWHFTCAIQRRRTALAFTVV